MTNSILTIERALALFVLITLFFGFTLFFHDSDYPLFVKTIILLFYNF